MTYNQIVEKHTICIMDEITTKWGKNSKNLKAVHTFVLNYLFLLDYVFQGTEWNTLLVFAAGFICHMLRNLLSFLKKSKVLVKILQLINLAETYLRYKGGNSFMLNSYMNPTWFCISFTFWPECLYHMGK